MSGLVLPAGGTGFAGGQVLKALRGRGVAMSAAGQSRLALASR
jgi:hypothetical protein